MFVAILILLILPFVDTSTIKGSSYKPIYIIGFWIFALNFLVLMWLGSCHVEAVCQLTHNNRGSWNSLYYFRIILILIRLSLIERLLLNITFFCNILFKEKALLLELLLSLSPKPSASGKFEINRKICFNICFVNSFEVSVIMVSKKSKRIFMGNLRLPQSFEIKFENYGNRTIIVPELIKYSIYNISNLMRKGRIVATSGMITRNKRTYHYFKKDNNKSVLNKLFRLKPNKPVMILLSNILSDSRFIKFFCPNNLNVICLRNRLSEPSINLRPFDVHVPKEDIIIVNMITFILGLIYIRKFSPYCYSLRTRSNVITALNNLKDLGKKKWIIKGSIPFKAVQSLNFNILMSILEKDISDRKFTSQIENALYNGYYKFYSSNWYNVDNGEYKYNLLNKPLPDSRFSDLLFNIYLREFDLFIHELQSTIKSNFFYVRYNDEFILGLNDGDISSDISLMIDEFFSNRLCLNLKLKKYDILNNSIKFLGIDFYRIGEDIKFFIPIKKIIKHFENNFFWNDNYLANIDIHYMSHEDILHFYNTLSLNYLKYYSFADNYFSLVQVMNHLLYSSCIKRLRIKYNLSNNKDVVDIFGNSLNTHLSAFPGQNPENSKDKINDNIFFKYSIKTRLPGFNLRIGMTPERLSFGYNLNNLNYNPNFLRSKIKVI